MLNVDSSVAFGFGPVGLGGQPVEYRRQDEREDVPRVRFGSATAGFVPAAGFCSHWGTLRTAILKNLSQTVVTRHPHCAE